MLLGDVDASGEQILARLDAGVDRSSSKRQDLLWVVQSFDRNRLWAGLIDRHHDWGRRVVMTAPGHVRP